MHGSWLGTMAPGLGQVEAEEGGERTGTLTGRVAGEKAVYGLASAQQILLRGRFRKAPPKEERIGL